jgi:hypothetical protein
MSKIVRLKESELVNLIKRVISEQVDGDTAGSAPSTSGPIPGFVFAEDDIKWLGPNRDKSSLDINNENYKRIFNYYGFEPGQELDPSKIIGKTAFAFKPITSPDQMQYSKEFLDPRMFTINQVSFSPKTKVGYVFSDKREKSTFIATFKSSDKVGKIKIKNNNGDFGSDVINSFFAVLYDKLSTDPKYSK